MDEIADTGTLYPSRPGLLGDIVPKSFGIQGINNMCAQNAIIEAAICQQLAVAKEGHSKLEERYQQLLIETGGVKYALRASNDAIATLEQYRDAMQITTQKLLIVHHPIRRCPHEVIREIIEIAVISSKTDHEWFRNVASFSKVCQLWRDVAMGCPFLWTRIAETNYRGITEVNQLFKCHRDRMKKEHAVIRLSSMDEEHVKIWDTIRACNLDQFEAIELLDISLDFPSVHWALGQVVLYSAGSLRRLSVTFQELEDYEETGSVDLNRIMDACPTAQNLSLHMYGSEFTVREVPVGTTHPLQSLEVYNYAGDSFSSLPHLPNLQRLVLTSSPYLGTGHLTLPTLQEFQFLGEGLEWSRISAPQIVKLVVKYPNPGTFSFIGRSPSLRHLSITIWHNPTIQYLENMTLQGSLEINDSCNEFVNWAAKSIHFGNLIRLTLNMTIHGFAGFNRYMSLQQFQQLLEDLKLQFASSTQGGTPPFEVEILGTEEYIESAPWRKSPLLKQFTQTKSEEPHSGQTILQLKLRAQV